MSETGGKRSGRRVTDRDVPQLLRALHDRERQLHELTEQSLGFLESLAESRRLNADREELVRRLGDLERALADAKHRLRHAGIGTPAAVTAGDREPAPLEIVGGEKGARERAAAVHAVAGVPVAWTGLPADL